MAKIQIIREFTISGKDHICTLPLHEGAKFLGFSAFPGQSPDWGMCFWADDEEAPKAPVEVTAARSRIPLSYADGRPYYEHLASDITRTDSAGAAHGIHLLRVIPPPKD